MEHIKKSSRGGIASYLVAFLSILLGVVLFTPFPKHLGLYRWFATNVDHRFIGLAPAYVYNMPYGFTLEELYSINLTGQSAIVSGANSGIGFAMSKAQH